MLTLLCLVAAVLLAHYFARKADAAQEEASAYKDLFHEEKLQMNRAQERSYALQDRLASLEQKRNQKEQCKAVRLAQENELRQQQLRASIRLAEYQTQADIDVEKELRIAAGLQQIGDGLIHGDSPYSLFDSAGNYRPGFGPDGNIGSEFPYAPAGTTVKYEDNLNDMAAAIIATDPTIQQVTTIAEAES